MAMILTESGFITQSENKPESMFKVGDLIRPTLNNQFDGMSTDEIWEVVEVNGYDRMNGYIYTIKPENDAAKAYRGENSTDGEAEGFAEIAGFENSPEEQAWILAKSKSIKEDIDIENINNIKYCIKSRITGKLDGGGQNSAYFAKWLEEADGFNWEKIAEIAYLMGYKLYKTNNGYFGDEDYLIVHPNFGPEIYGYDLDDETKEYWSNEVKDLIKVESIRESFDESNEHSYKVEKRHVYERKVITSYFDSYDEAKLDAEDWIANADSYLQIYAKSYANSAFAYIYHWNGSKFEYIELVNEESINMRESFEYDETSEEDQGLFDGIGTKVVDTLFSGVQFEPAEMEKLDEAIDLLIWVYKSVKSRSVKTTNESIDNKHYKNVNTVNGKNVVAAHLSSEHKEYKDTYLGYVSFELDDGSDICYPVDLDGNLVDDKNAWEFIKKQGLPKVTFGGKVIKESRDIDTLLDAAGGVEEARMGIAMTLQNHPDMDEEELAEFLADDEISYEEWLSIIEYLDADIY